MMSQSFYVYLYIAPVIRGIFLYDKCVTYSGVRRIAKLS